MAARLVAASRSLLEAQSSILDRLYSLEIEFHRLFRAEGINAAEAAGVHTGFALRNNDEPLLRAIGVVAPSELSSATERKMGMGDPRDVQAAYHSLRQLIRVA